MKSYTEAQIKALKLQAKQLKKALGLSHAQALDQIAENSGYKNWSLLMKHSIQLGSLASGPSSSNNTPPPSLDDMVDWFTANHSPAVEESPYDTAEGGYLWPTIDDVDIDDILRDQFPTASDELIEEAALALHEDGPWMDPDFMKKLDGDE